MPRQMYFDTPEPFLEALRSQLDAGTPPQNLWVHMPYPVHEAEQLLIGRPSRMRRFALAGGLGGFLGGFLLALLTSVDWPIITGGKPIVSIPPFLLIGYLMTILFGSLVSFAGFLWLARLPDPGPLVGDEAFDSRFILTIHDEEAA